MSIRQIVYVSSGVRVYTADEVEKIADAGRINNTEHGVTGILLYYNGNFMQLLEGDPASVAETFKRVSNDFRHSGIIKLQDSIVETRSFPDYRLGFSAITRDAAKPVSELFEELPAGWGVKPDAKIDRKIVTLFHTFFSINSGASRNSPRFA